MLETADEEVSETSIFYTRQLNKTGYNTMAIRYVDREPDMAAGKIKMEIDESQLKRFEDCISRFEKAANIIPRKTIKSRLVDFFCGRIMLVGMFAGYLFLQNGIPDFSKVQKEVLNFDQSSGILTIKAYDELENYIFKDGKVTKNGKEVNDDYLEKVGYSILLGTDFPVKEGFF